jgi:hypothetical protein
MVSKRLWLGTPALSSGRTSVFPPLQGVGPTFGASQCRRRRAVPQRERQTYAGATSVVQNAHRDAAIGIALRHSGQSRVVDSTSGPVRRRSMR